jgi:hypothetical protein
MESRCVGRVAFLAPLANFADFRDHDIFGFGRRVGESVPQDRVGVEVSISVQNFTVAERAFSEGPPDEIGACVGTGSVSGRLSDGNTRNRRCNWWCYSSRGFK